MYDFEENTCCYPKDSAWQIPSENCRAVADGQAYRANCRLSEQALYAAFRCIRGGRKDRKAHIRGSEVIH